MTELLAEFHIRTIPQFDAAEADIRLYDCLVGQRALWSHLAFSILNEAGAMAELRIARAEAASRIRVSLRLYGERSEATLRSVAEAAAMLPTQFSWEALDVARDQGEADLAAGQYLARVVRRMEFVDLPAKSDYLIKSGSAALDKWARTVPSSETDMLELQVRRICLPLLGSIDEHPPRQRSLFEEFQRTGSGAISICLHRLDRQDHLQFQKLGLNWKRFLDPFATELASAGFATLPALRATYDRFGLPGAYLLNTSVRVAAGTPEAAVGLANVLAATLGGTRAFGVLPPTRRLSAAEVAEQLVSDSDDIPGSWLADDRADAREHLRQTLRRTEGLDEIADDALVDFILHLPHIFTLEESQQLVQFPVANEEGLPGLDSQLVPPFTTPNLDFLPTLSKEGGIARSPAGRLRVGMVQMPGTVRLIEGVPGADRYRTQAWHTLDLRDLTKHALIVGSTGSGKTMTTLFLAREMVRLGVNLMVIEPVKTEYFDALEAKIPGLRRYNLEGAAGGDFPAEFLAFDPLRVPAGISVARHASYLKSCFQAAFPMDDVTGMVLQTALIEYYTARTGCGFSKYERGPEPQIRSSAPDGNARVYPSFETFYRFLIDDYLPRAFPERVGSNNRSKEVREMFERRFESLAKGPVGDCFRAVVPLALRENDVERFDEPLKHLLDQNTVIELDAVPDAEQKALLMAFLMTYLFERRQGDDFLARRSRRAAGEPRQDRGLKHFLILEEAHRLLSNGASHASRSSDTAGESAQSKSVGLFVDMLAEIRAYGQGLAIVEQIPTKIVPEAVKNTNLKIMLRMTAKDDREYLGQAMNFTPAQMRFVNNLKVEKGRQINFVCFEEGVEQPILLSLPLPSPAAEVRPDWMYDEFFEQEA